MLARRAIMTALASAVSSAGCGDAIGTPLRASILADAGSTASLDAGPAPEDRGTGSSQIPFVDDASLPFDDADLASLDPFTYFGGEIPAGDHCAKVSVWPLRALYDEWDMVQRINALRSVGSWSCGGQNSA